MKIIKKKNYDKDVMNIIRDNIDMYDSVHNLLKDLFDEPNESVYMILFSGNTAVSLQPVSKSAGTATSVELDFDIIESTLAGIDGTGVSYAMAHNHPYMEVGGEWVETLISDADVLTTKRVNNYQRALHPTIKYFGHFVVNKEMDDKRKIIFFDDEEQFKYTKEIVNLIRDGEL